MAIACPNTANDTSVASGTTSAALSAPVNWTTGDVLVAFKCDRATSGTTTAPTGWTRIASAAAASNYRHEVFVGAYGQGSIGAGPWSFTGTTRTLVRCLRFTGASITNPSDCTASARSNASGTTGTTSITPVTPGAWIVGGFASSATTDTWSLEACATDPTTLTERQESAYSTYMNLAVCAAAQSSSPRATGVSSGTMSVNGVNNAGLMALRPLELNFTHQGDLKPAGTWKSDRTIEKIIGTVAQTQSLHTEADSWVKLIGTIRQTAEWHSDVTSGVASLDFTYQGALAEAGTWKSDRTIEKIINSTINEVGTYQSVRGIEKLIGLLSQEKWNNSTRIVDKLFSGTLNADSTWKTDLVTTLNFIYQAQLAQAGTWQHDRVIEKVISGTLNANETWQAVRGIEKVITGNLSQTDTWLLDRMTEHLWQGALAQTDTWQAIRGIEKVVQGNLSAVETWQAIRGIEKVINSTLSSGMTWQMYFEGIVLNYIHQGTLSKIQFLASIIAKEMVQQGAISNTQTWLTEKQKEALIQGTLSQTETWNVLRTIERIIQGGTQDEETWKSTVTREALILAQLMQLKTWQVEFYATNYRWVGTLFQTKSWSSTVCVDYKWLGKLAQTKTWGSASWKAHNMLHQGAINSIKTWASVNNREHLVQSNLTMEHWFRQFTPFSEKWGKDSGTITGWTNQSGTTSVWTKQSPTTESWNKRGIVK